ncbi:hypothetical protein GUITHDRAFT_99568 [Guillardia theta CCMP2712]|uniref:AB hydrolase-1 domain-containing protein n=1 Tax=Guillardia theta (strain CCMP2712) TaxID=905079 RepID=L1K2W2_GUITC|nr:hypothetical protein GUITHDRAFT_99568 [Guillardia theta CCMP2712]EKX54917.1 hypothetical protein GUITHDRAFT_99568 [Guillardia theta CCMP2712]|eukprot:XP_005841897.1 hypothetical protein GUITHDRAFT_99568 [Guillardia theta CCMP2712]
MVSGVQLHADCELLCREHQVTSHLSSPPTSCFDPDILRQQTPTTTVPSGMPQPQLQVQIDNLKLEAIPWLATMTLALSWMPATHSLLPTYAHVLAELVFASYLTVQARLLDSPKAPEPLSRDVRELWELCLMTGAEGPREFLSGWFYGADFERIRREDMHDFLAWATFSSTPDRLEKESKRLLEDVLQLIEERTGSSFRPRSAGESPLPCMRFNIEPLQFTHKPLLYYAVCQSLLGSLGSSQLGMLGFEKFGSDAFDYWMRVPKSLEGRKRTPIVFFHGVGVGLVTYVSVLRELVALDCPILCVEIPFVSSNLEANVPSISEQVASMESIFARWDISKAFFVGHSYGTVMTSWMIHHLPSRVAGVALIDPVVMMLNLRDILFNFLYRHEREGSISDLIGSELFLNHALRRNFWWYRNILWAQDLEKHKIPSIICLSERDQIVPSSAVLHHIAEHAAGLSEASCVEAYVMGDAKHGQLLFDEEIRNELVSKISGMWRRVNEATPEESAVMRTPPPPAAPRSLTQLAVQVRWRLRRVARPVLQLLQPTSAA